MRDSVWGGVNGILLCERGPLGTRMTRISRKPTSPAAQRRADRQAARSSGMPGWALHGPSLHMALKSHPTTHTHTHTPRAPPWCHTCAAGDATGRGGGGMSHFGLALPYYTHFTSPIRWARDTVLLPSAWAAPGGGDSGTAGGRRRLPPSAQCFCCCRQGLARTSSSNAPPAGRRPLQAIRRRRGPPTAAGCRGSHRPWRRR